MSYLQKSILLHNDRMSRTRVRHHTSRNWTPRRSSAYTRAKRSEQKRRKIWKLWWKRLLIAAVVLVCLPIAARVYVHFSVADRVYSDIDKVPHCHVAMVLGAWVHPDGTLSESLASRVDKAIALYKAGKCDKLLMSGDNRFKSYNEPDRMCEYAIAHGVPPKAIVPDYAGRRTFDSVYRAKNIFSRSKMIIVTQAFHIDRAVFLGEHVGIDAYGVSTPSVGDTRATIREIPACVDALMDVYLLHPHPVMGKKIRI